MDLLKNLGAIAGIGGIALGVFFLLFKDIIAKRIFSKLPAQESYRLMRLIIVCVWSVAVLGMILWFTNGLQLVIGNNNSITKG